MSWTNLHIHVSRLAGQFFYWSEKHTSFWHLIHWGVVFVNPLITTTVFVVVATMTKHQFFCIIHYRRSRGSLNDLWIGLRLDVSKLPVYTYRHVDGSVANYFPWDTKDQEPNYQSYEHCIRLEKSNKPHTMRTSPCSGLHSFLCERTPQLGMTRTVKKKEFGSSISIPHPWWWMAVKHSTFYIIVPPVGKIKPCWNTSKEL